MKTPPEQLFRSFADKAHTAIKTAAFLAGIIGIYVWILTIPNGRSSWAAMFAESPFDPYAVSFTLDSLCVVFLFLGFFVRQRLNTICAIGISFAGFSLILRLFDFWRWSGDMFWFEPYLRSGIYVASFGLALAAHKVLEPYRHSDNQTKYMRQDTEQVGAGDAEEAV